MPSKEADKLKKGPVPKAEPKKPSVPGYVNEWGHGTPGWVSKAAKAASKRAK